MVKLVERQGVIQATLQATAGGGGVCNNVIVTLCRGIDEFDVCRTRHTTVILTPRLIRKDGWIDVKSEN